MAWSDLSVLSSRSTRKSSFSQIQTKKKLNGESAFPQAHFTIVTRFGLSRLEVLRALVGHIPPHPLWAELLWQRQEEIAKRMQSAQQIIPQQQPSRQR